MQYYEQQIAVTSEHLDERSHVNNVVFVEWLQEVSRSHWEREASKAIQDQYFWVVRTHHIEYRKQVFLDDNVLAKTHVAGYKGPFSDRVVKFYRDGELLVAATSTWCMLDVQTSKPTKVPEQIIKLFE